MPALYGFAPNVCNQDRIHTVKSRSSKNPIPHPLQDRGLENQDNVAKRIYVNCRFYSSSIRAHQDRTVQRRAQHFRSSSPSSWLESLKCIPKLYGTGSKYPCQVNQPTRNLLSPPNSIVVGQSAFAATD